MSMSASIASAFPLLPDGWLLTPLERLPVLQSLVQPMHNVFTQEIISGMNKAAYEFDDDRMAVDDETIFINLACLLTLWAKNEVTSKGRITREAAIRCGYIQAAIAADVFRMCGWRNVYVIAALPEIEGVVDNEHQAYCVLGASRMNIFKSVVTNVIPDTTIVAYERYQYEMYKLHTATTLN